MIRININLIKLDHFSVLFIVDCKINSKIKKNSKQENLIIYILKILNNNSSFNYFKMKRI